MKIENIKDLTSVVDLCRKKGVSKIIISGIEINMTEFAPAKPVKESDDKVKVEDALTDEQLLFWSSAEGA